MSNNKKTISLDIISKYRNVVYGFAALWIALFHGYAIDKIDYSFGLKGLHGFRVFMETGNVGVDIFLFLSGISLFYAYLKYDKLYDFIKNRLLKLFVSSWVVFGIYWIVRYFIIGHMGFRSIINRFLLLQFWMTGDKSIYFVSCILFLYLLYPYINEFIFKNNINKSIIIRTVLLLIITYLSIICFSKLSPSLYNKYEIAITRFPVFIMGAMVGKYVYEKKKIDKRWFLLPIIGTIAFFVIYDQKILHGYNLRFFYAFGGICISLTLVYLSYLLDKLFDKIKIKNFVVKFFTFFGAFSLEIYLTHIMINQIYNLTPLFRQGNLKRYLVVVVVSIIMAYVFSLIINKILMICKKHGGKDDKKVINQI